MFDSDSFHKGVELGMRLGQKRALFDLWLHDLPDARSALLDIVFDLEELESEEKTEVYRKVAKVLENLSDIIKERQEGLEQEIKNDTV